jgi:hypothetical protein
VLASNSKQQPDVPAGLKTSSSSSSSSSSSGGGGGGALLGCTVNPSYIQHAAALPHVQQQQY